MNITPLVTKLQQNTRMLLDTLPQENKQAFISTFLEDQPLCRINVIQPDGAVCFMGATIPLQDRAQIGKKLPYRGTFEDIMPYLFVDAQPVNTYWIVWDSLSREVGIEAARAVVVKEIRLWMMKQDVPIQEKELVAA